MWGGANLDPPVNETPAYRENRRAHRGGRSPRTSAAAAPSTSAARGLAVWATQPASGPPMGVEPRNTTEYSAITRPRISGATSSWSVEFTPAANVTLAAPTSARAATVSGSVGAAAASAVARPKAALAPTSSAGDTRPRAPAVSAPAIDPAAIDTTSAA